jgi:hypothetical protein
MTNETTNPSETSVPVYEFTRRHIAEYTLPNNGQEILQYLSLPFIVETVLLYCYHL